MTDTLSRFLTWYVKTYGAWAVRHEPWSFAIYPLVTALGALPLWLGFGARFALWFLAYAEVVNLLFAMLVFARRRRIKRSNP